MCCKDPISNYVKTMKHPNWYLNAPCSCCCWSCCWGETLWKNLWSYGIPIKSVSLMLYNHFILILLILGDSLSEWFPVKSGAWQRCILSPILFLVATVWIMTMIQWKLFSHFEDLYFVDDLAVLSAKHSNLQEKTRQTNKQALKSTQPELRPC